MARAPEWLLVIDQLGIRGISPSLAALVCSHSCHLSLQTLNLRFHPFQAWKSSLNHENQKDLQLWLSVTLDFVWKGWRDMLSWLECCAHGSLSCGGVCYIVGASLPAPKCPSTCHVMYYIISQILIAHLTIFFDYCQKHRNYILKLFCFWGFLANFMVTS